MSKKKWFVETVIGLVDAVKPVWIICLKAKFMDISLWSIIYNQFDT